MIAISAGVIELSESKLEKLCGQCEGNEPNKLNLKGAHIKTAIKLKKRRLKRGTYKKAYSNVHAQTV